MTERKSALSGGPKSIPRTALVTGATSGFGAAICRRFVAEGTRVLAVGRRQDRLRDLENELGKSCRTAAIDVRDRDEVGHFLSKLPPDFGELDVLVANAGLALGLSPAHQADLDDWQTMIDTNITGLVYTVRAILPGMVARGRGHVVLMGSVAADTPYPGGNAYGATKAFVKQFAYNLKADLIGTGVRVTDIAPGLADTEFSLVRFKGDKAKAAAPYKGTQPLTADDVAEGVWWACALPPHVNINRLEMMPADQAYGPFAIHRRSS